MGILLRTILLVLSLMVFSSAYGSDKTPCVVVRVIDGDTFRCRLNSGEEVRVRLIGIDAPETSDNPKAIRDAQRTGQSLEEITRMGRLSKEFAERLLPRGEIVFLEFDVQRTDKYGRLLAYVWLPDGRLLNEVMVEEGYAMVYTIPPNVKYQERFLKAQSRARENRKGLWRMQ